MGLEDYEEELEKELEDYSDDGEEELRIFTNRVCAVIIIVCIVFGMAIVIFVATMEPGSENGNGTPPPTKGRISFWLYCDDIYVCPFDVYVKGEGMPNPNYIGWEWIRCDKDYVDCYYTGSYDFFGGTLMLDPGSTFAMHVALPFGSYDYEIEVGSTVERSGSVYLSEQDHREIVSFHYNG